MAQQQRIAQRIWRVGNDADKLRAIEQALDEIVPEVPEVTENVTGQAQTGAELAALAKAIKAGFDNLDGKLEVLIHAYNNQRSGKLRPRTAG